MRIDSFGLVDGAEVEERQDLEVGNTEFFEMVDSRLLSESQKLTFVDDTGMGRHSEVTQMGLIDDDIGRVGHRRTDVFIEIFGVGCV